MSSYYNSSSSITSNNSSSSSINNNSSSSSSDGDNNDTNNNIHKNSSSDNSNNTIIAYYRITGPQSIDRIHPLLKLIGNIYWIDIDGNSDGNIKCEIVMEITNKNTADISVICSDNDDSKNNNDDNNDEQVLIHITLQPQNQPSLPPQSIPLSLPLRRPLLQSHHQHQLHQYQLQFVWETSCKISERSQHSQSTILNKLHNSQIIENKSNLAYLQLLMKENDSDLFVLDTYIARDSYAVGRWVKKYFNLSDDMGGKIIGNNDVSERNHNNNSSSSSNNGADIDGMNNITYSNDNGNDDNNNNDDNENNDAIENSMKNNKEKKEENDNRNNKEINGDWWVVKASKGNGGRDIWILNENNYQTVMEEIPPEDGRCFV